MSDPDYAHFLADGHCRAAEVIEKEVRSQVLTEYAPLLQSASWSRRLLLMRKARREIRRRMEQVLQSRAPPDALY